MNSTNTGLLADGPHWRAPYAFTRSNTWPLPDDPVMRIGVPHGQGRLAAGANDGDRPLMVSAAAFWDGNRGYFRDAFGPLSDGDIALDSAGFTAVANWQAKGTQAGMAGVYPWTAQQYVDLAESLNPRFWSQPDLCCEPAVAADPAERRRRIDVTASLLGDALDAVVARWSAGPSTLRPCVPVLQGYTVDEYRRSLDLMQEQWARYSLFFDPPILVGVGSVCRRDLHHPEHGLYAIVEGLAPHLPPQMRLHMFGVKGAATRRLFEMPEVASADSMAWDVAARRKAHKERRSNSIARRLEELQAWESRHEASTETKQQRLAL
ncbi:MAG: DUF7221 family queuine tRNA-ribosyltransferase-like protein [Rhodanobacter sp.]